MSSSLSYQNLCYGRSLFSISACSPSLAFVALSSRRPPFLERHRHVRPCLARLLLIHDIVPAGHLPRAQVVLAGEALGVHLGLPGVGGARLLHCFRDEGRQLQHTKKSAQSSRKVFPPKINARSASLARGRGGMREGVDCAYLGVLGPMHGKHICPDLVPVRREVAVAVDCAHRPDAVALVVFFARLLGAEREAPECALQGGGGLEHGGWLCVRRARTSKARPEERSE